MKISGCKLPNEIVSPMRSQIFVYAEDLETMEACVDGVDWFVSEGLEGKPIAECIARASIHNHDHATWLERTYYENKYNADNRCILDRGSKITYDDIGREGSKIGNGVCSFTEYREDGSYSNIYALHRVGLNGISLEMDRAHFQPPFTFDTLLEECGVLGTEWTGVLTNVYPVEGGWVKEGHYNSAEASTESFYNNNRDLEFLHPGEIEVKMRDIQTYRKLTWSKKQR